MGCMTCATAVFSFFHWLIGGSMLGVGIWLMVDGWPSPYVYRVLIDHEIYWEVMVYALMAAGGLIILAGFLGCIGACTGTEGVLVVYGILTGLAIIGEIAVIVCSSIISTQVDSYSYYMNNDAFSTMKDHVKSSYVDENSQDSVTVALNKMQLQLECCGAGSHRDYVGSEFEKNSPAGVYVPWTCCVLKSGVNSRDAVRADLVDYNQCQRDAEIYGGLRNSPYLSTQGCYGPLDNLIDIAAIAAWSAMPVFIVVQVVALGISCCLLSSKQKVSPESRAI